MTENIEITKAAGVLTIVIDRQPKKNALTDAMYGAMADALEASDGDPDTRVVLLRAEGDMFTAGNDVMEFAAIASGANGEGPRNVARFIEAIARASKPLVAAVQGRAVGIGTTMLLHCDYVVLAEDAKLTTPFVSLALVPEAASSLLLTARIGHARAFAMFALDAPVSARDAVAWGLANEVVPLGELASAAQRVVARLARQPLGALVATKKLMRPTEVITAHMDVESKVFLERLVTAEAREAFTAFVERRPPDFAAAATRDAARPAG